MWIKLAVAGCVLAFCILLGYLAAGKYRARKKFYFDFSAFNERYMSELKYRRRAVKEVVGECAEGEFRSAILRGLQGEELRPPAYLTEEEQGFYTEYVGMLGKGDSRSQTDFFEHKRGEIEEKRKSAEAEAKSRGELYWKLGLLFGLAFIILII